MPLTPRASPSPEFKEAPQHAPTFAQAHNYETPFKALYAFPMSPAPEELGGTDVAITSATRESTSPNRTTGARSISRGTSPSVGTAASGNTTGETQLIRTTWQRWGRGRESFGSLGTVRFRQGFMPPAPAQLTTPGAGTPPSGKPTRLSKHKRDSMEITASTGSAASTDGKNSSSSEESAYNFISYMDTQTTVDYEKMWDDFMSPADAALEPPSLDIDLGISAPPEDGAGNFEWPDREAFYEAALNAAHCQEAATAAEVQALYSFLSSFPSIIGRDSEAGWTESTETFSAPSIDPKQLCFQPNSAGLAGSSAEHCAYPCEDPYADSRAELGPFPESDSRTESPRSPGRRARGQKRDLPGSIRKSVKQKQVRFERATERATELMFVHERLSYGSDSGPNLSVDQLTPPPDVDLNEQVVFVPPRSPLLRVNEQKPQQWQVLGQ